MFAKTNINKLKILGLLLVFMFFSVIASAVKAKDIPPWMEDIEESGRSTYLVPKGAKRKVVGSQIIVEAPSEYVARRLYEMERYLQQRFKIIEENQEKFQKELEALKVIVGGLQPADQIVRELEEIKFAIEELRGLKAVIDQPEILEDSLEGKTEGVEVLEEPAGPEIAE